jgi:DNA helicase-2/ATP-dependent DNA helicase PcrA
MDRLPRDDVSYIIKARQRGEKLKARPRVRISTIHSAKGGEADHVVLFKEVARRTARETEQNPDPERRVQYVAVTRAKEKLTIVESAGPEECSWL